MKKIKIIVTLVCLCLLSGCGGYTRDETPGEIVKISVAEMQEKMENKDDFAVIFTQSWCSHCEDLKEMLSVYLKNHHVILYEVSIDRDPNPNRKENLEIIRNYFTDLNSTPATYYVEDGVMKNELKPDKNGIGEMKFDSWVQNNRLDEKKGN